MDYKYKYIKKYISTNYFIFAISKLLNYFLLYVFTSFAIYFFLILFSLLFNYKAIVFYFINYFVLSLFPFFIIYPLFTLNNNKFLQIIDYENILFSYLYLINKNNYFKSEIKNNIKITENLLLDIFYKKYLYPLKLKKNNLFKIKIRLHKSIYILLVLNITLFCLIETISYKKYNSFFLSYIGKDRKEILNLEKIIDKNRKKLYDLPIIKTDEKQFLLKKIEKIKTRITKKSDFQESTELLEILNKLEKKIKQPFNDENKTVKYKNKKTGEKNTENLSDNKTKTLNQHSVSNKNELNKINKELQNQFLKSYVQNQNGFNKFDNKIFIESPLKNYKTFVDILYTKKKGKQFKNINILSNENKLEIINILFHNYFIENSDFNVIDDDILKLYNIYIKITNKNN